MLEVCGRGWRLSVNQEVSWIWVSLLLWLQLVHHRLQLMVAVNCVCGVEPGVPEEFSEHLCFTLSFQLSLHNCRVALSRTLVLTPVIERGGHSLLLFFLWAWLVVGVMGFLCCPGLVSVLDKPEPSRLRLSKHSCLSLQWETCFGAGHQPVDRRFLLPPFAKVQWLFAYVCGQRVSYSSLRDKQVLLLFFSQKPWTSAWS